MQEVSEEMGEDDVFLNLKGEYKEGLAVGVGKKAEPVPTRMGLAATSAECISQLCECSSPV